MVGDEAVSVMVAIGVGCRKGSSAPAIERLIRQALGRTPEAAPLGLFTIIDKDGETGLAEAATRLRLPLVFLTREALMETGPSVQTRSPIAAARFGIPSVAEAAALAGAGPGARLIVARIAEDGVTCAIAAAEGEIR